MTDNEYMPTHSQRFAERALGNAKRLSCLGLPKLVGKFGEGDALHGGIALSGFLGLIITSGNACVNTYGISKLFTAGIKWKL